MPMENREEKEGQVQKEVNRERVKCVRGRGKGDYMICRELQCACIRGTCSPVSSQFYPRKKGSGKVRGYQGNEKIEEATIT